MPTAFDYQLPANVPVHPWNPPLDAVIRMMHEHGLGLHEMEKAMRGRALLVARLESGNFSRAARWLHVHRGLFFRAWTMFLEQIRDDERRRKGGM